MRVKPHDMIVLHKLRNNARLKHTTIARQMRWPVSTTQERVRRCLDHFVSRPVALVDLTSLGFPVRTMWIVRPRAHSRLGWEASVKAHRNTNNLSRLHHGEYLVQTAARTRREEEAIREVLSQDALVVATHPIIDEIVVEKFLTDTGHLSAMGIDTGKPATQAEERPN